MGHSCDRPVLDDNLEMIGLRDETDLRLSHLVVMMRKCQVTPTRVDIHIVA